MSCLSHTPQPGTRPTTQACALPRNRTSDLCFVGQHSTSWATPVRAACRLLIKTFTNMFYEKQSFSNQLWPLRLVHWPKWLGAMAKPKPSKTNPKHTPLYYIKLFLLIISTKTSHLSQFLSTSALSFYVLGVDSWSRQNCKVSFSIKRKTLFIGFKFIFLNMSHISKNIFFFWRECANPTSCFHQYLMVSIILTELPWDTC